MAKGLLIPSRKNLMKPQTPVLNFIVHDERWAALIQNWQEEIASALEKTAEELNKNFSHQEVNIVLTDDAEIQALNKTFRNFDKPTNVLSFPSGDEENLGDIIMAYETVVREAIQEAISPLHHTLHLIIHGFLHLLGYDHDAEEEAQIMEGLEIQILSTLNITNPYEEK